ncbi:hypothetical protein L1887_00560 [Cichorium endivia]|nr:hypothetical protein L1887_00560 [Cichorium endivia]
MSVKTVKVSNLSLKASPRDVREFFSFSGDIAYVEVQSNDENSQNAFVTFKDTQGAETAVLLSGATIVDMIVTVNLAPDYHLPLEATSVPRGGPTTEDESIIRKAEDVVNSMFAKAKSFDERIGFSEKVTTGTTVVSEKVKEVDQKLQVSEKAKSAYAAAEQSVSNAGSALMKNRYVVSTASWVTEAFSKVGKVGQQTKEDEVVDDVVDDVAPTQQQTLKPVEGLIL